MNTEQLDPTSDRPLASQLADLLRAQIRSGERRPGSKLPSESEFQTEFGLSRTPIRTALADLAAEGLVVTRKGYGSYVRDARPIRRVVSRTAHAELAGSGKPVFDTIVESQGHRASRRILQVGRVPLPRNLAESLQLSPGSEVILRQRLQFIDDEPAVIASSYYPLWVGEGSALEDAGAIPVGPDALIESMGHRFAGGSEIVSARMPSADEARLLRLDAGVPVIRVVRTDYDEQHRALQIADDLYAADRHEFAFAWSDDEGAR